MPFFLPLVLLIIHAFVQFARAGEDYDDAPHFYSKAVANDPVASLSAALEQKQTILPEGPDHELGVALLKSLEISPHSQVLVFSKTSLQRDKITPANPRAIYFNDETYFAWVPGGMFEFTGLHPQLGAYFYGLDPENTTRPHKISRHANCLDCHAGGMTGHWPGMMVRSVHTDARGFPLLQAGSKLVDHCTPLTDRWGGWYVTGQHGAARPMGNSVAKENGDSVSLDREAGANRNNLTGLGIVSETEYLGKGSDIVALMVLEHQIMIQNAMTAASYEVRGAIQRRQLLQKELGEPADIGWQGSAKVVAESHARKLLQAMLFCKEAALPEGGIEGGAAYREAFLANRKKTENGRSLKDLQLLTRLFKYRCSYQIYSRSWLGLPEPFKQLCYKELRSVLQDPEAPADYKHLGTLEKQAIFEILRNTHPEISLVWR